MSKIGIISDSHIGARSDSLVFDDYFHKFYQDIFFPTLKEQNITEVWHLGDVVDRRKFININILSRFRKKFLHKLEDMGVSMVSLLGNHDTYHKNTNEVNSIQEILGGWDNIQIYTLPEEIECHGRKVLFMPWINQDNFDVSMGLLEHSEAELVMGHFEISGFQMYSGIKCENGFDAHIFDRFSMVLSGHFHHKSSDGNIHYVGSPYEITFSDMNDAKGFHILDTEDLSLTFIQNPYKMFHRVVYDDRGKTLDVVLNSLNPVSRFENSYVKVVCNFKSNPYYFDKFLDLLYSVSPADIKVIEEFTYDAENTEVSEGAEDTLTILGKHIDQMEYFEGDKNRLKDMVRTLYLESTNMEF